VIEPELILGMSDPTVHATALSASLSPK
jgi:hypothetical protein